MNVASIESVINAKFLSALARAGGSATTKFGQAPSAGDSISVALQTGLRTYVAAVQGLNTAASFVNIAHSDLGELGKLVSQMKDAAKSASKPGTGAQARSEADNRIQKLGKQFEKFIETAEFQGQNYLTKDGLGGLLRTFGLDESTAADIGDAFERFQVPEGDNNLASETVDLHKVVPIPDDAYTKPTSVSRSSTKYTEIFDPERHLKNRPDAYKFLSDLDGLEKQIEKNQKALDNLQGVVLDNLKLVRATGLAFLSQSQSQIDNPQDADEVARQLSIKIRADAGSAISHAGNLEAITVASLLLSQTSS